MHLFTHLEMLIRNRALRTPAAYCLTLLCGLVIASAAAYGQTIYTVPLLPKYQVLAVVYAPPGSASSVTYSDSVSVGTANSFTLTNSFNYSTSSSTTAGISLFGIGVSTTNTNTQGWGTTNQSSSSLAIQTTQGNSVATAGPVSSALGVNHDNDIIYIWLNPVVMTTTTNTTTPVTLSWTGLQANSCDLTDPADQTNFYQAMNGCDENQYPFADIVGIPVWCLKNPYYPGPSCAQWLTYNSRSWDFNTWGVNSSTNLPLGPGLTPHDYADILSADPFVTQTLVPANTNAVYYCHPSYGVNLDPNDQETILATPTATPPSGKAFPADFCGVPNDGSSTYATMQRFQAYDTVQYPEPGINGEPQTYTGSFAYSTNSSNTNTATHTSTSGNSTSTTLSFGTSGFQIPFVSALGASMSFSVTSGTSQSWTNSDTTSTTETTVTNNAATYSITGPQASDNYTGPTTFNVYKDNVFGTFAFYSDLQLQQPPIELVSTSLAAGTSPIGVSSPTSFGTVAVGSSSSSQAITLTNNSPYQMTMVAPAVTFSVPGFQIVPGTDNCSNALLQPYDSSTSIGPYICTMSIQFVPAVSNAPNSIKTTYPLTASLIAAGTENVPFNYESTPYYQDILVTSTGMTVSGTATPATTCPTTSTVYPECNVGGTLYPATPYAGSGSILPQANGYQFAAYSGTAESEKFTFTNYYSSPVTFPAYPADISFSDAYDFGLEPNSGSTLDTCAGKQIAAAGTCVVYVKYQPSANGFSASGVYGSRVTAMGEVNWPTGTSATIPLAFGGAMGTVVGISMGPSFSCTAIDLGGGGTPSCTSVTINNPTSSVFTFTSESPTGGFGMSVCSTIAANSTCTETPSFGYPTCSPAGNTCTASGTITIYGTLGGASVSAEVNGSAQWSDCIPPNGCGAGVVRITGTEQSKTITKPATYANATISISGSVTAPFSGERTIALTVGGFTASASYKSDATALGVAKALAAAANVSGSPVTAKVSGDSIALTSTTAGTAGNIAYTATDSSDFTVSPGSGSLSGGVNAGTTDEYDAGTVQAIVGGITASSNWGKTSTDETLAKALASSLNALAKGAFTATASQNTVTITPAPGNSVPGVTANVEDSMGFSPASFAASTSN
jgi:hypothetical protein